METNPGPRRPVPAVCRILCSNVRGLAGNLGDLTVASSQHNILLIYCCYYDILLLLASMAAEQAEDVRASFLFVGDVNGHHQEWLGSTTTNRHGVAAYDFATVSG